MSRVADTPDTDPSGVPTGSSPTAPSGALRRPGGSGRPGPTATLDAQSEAEAAINREVAPSPSQMGQQQDASASDPRPSHWWPAFVDNDARPVPTTRETVTVKGGVL